MSHNVIHTYDCLRNCGKLIKNNQGYKYIYMIQNIKFNLQLWPFDSLNKFKTLKFDSPSWPQVRPSPPRYPHRQKAFSGCKFRWKIRQQECPETTAADSSRIFHHRDGTKVAETNHHRNSPLSLFLSSSCRILL